MKESPVQIAAEKESVELLSLLAEYAAPNPAGIRTKLLKLIIETEGQQEASLDDFKEHLKSLSASQVTSLNLYKIKAYCQQTA